MCIALNEVAVRVTFLPFIVEDTEIREKRGEKLSNFFPRIAELCEVR